MQRREQGGVAARPSRSRNARRRGVERVNEPESGIAVALHTADPGDSGAMRRQGLLALTMRGRT